MKVVVTGATGFVGSALVPVLRERGDEVTVLTRDPARAARLGVPAVAAELEDRGPWQDALAGADAIVHLAGEPVGARRWDARQKQRIRDSRVESTRTLVEAVADLPPDRRPGALLCASGIDYYAAAMSGPLDDDEVTERDPPSESFLGRVCRDWEREAREAEALGLRVAMMRTGLVLGPGGPLARMVTPFKLLAGGPIGRGRQWVSWIHLADAAAAYAAAVHDERFTGAINLVTGSVRNRDFARALGQALGRPSWLPVPAFALRAAIGELADYVLAGRNVVPARLDELGFTPTHPTLAEALRSALA